MGVEAQPFGHPGVAGYEAKQDAQVALDGWAALPSQETNLPRGDVRFAAMQAELGAAVAKAQCLLVHSRQCGDQRRQIAGFGASEWTRVANGTVETFETEATCC